jgi:FAD:protein FMN transferase
MATRFELLLDGRREAYLRAAGEEAMATIQRTEAQLSFYRATSDVGRLNARAAHEPVRVTPELMQLLLRARTLHAATAGMFDVTVGPLMRCWRLAEGSGAPPDEAALDAARRRVGMALVELDEAACTVRFARPGVEIDLGGIGKGYALDQAVAVLREAGVERALLHGGTSSVYGMGAPAGADDPGAPAAVDAWNVAIEYPSTPPAPGAEPPAAALAAMTPAGAEVTGDDVLAVVALRDRALSVSAVWGRSFEAGGVVYGHVMDPALGGPVEGALLAAAACDSATDADALATALLALGPARAGLLDPRCGAVDTLVLARGAGGRAWDVRTRGIVPRMPEQDRNE